MLGFGAISGLPLSASTYVAPPPPPPDPGIDINFVAEAAGRVFAAAADSRAYTAEHDAESFLALAKGRRFNA